MADLSHELGALRFVVDSPLSSKVAMFNNQVNQHKNSQLLNPFAQADGRSSPKPSFSKDEYGKPLAGSLTEMRGQKANIHVIKEMLELCQIIDSEGYNVKDEPDMRVIPFGELFNIYNYISDKVVGILLRARKHKLVEFEGEMLFQRRDDDVPIFLLKPVAQIRREMDDKIESIKRAGSPAPQATSVLLDKKAHGLDVPKGKSRASVSRTPTPQSSKAASPAREAPGSASPVPSINAEKPKIQISAEPEAEIKEHNENIHQQPTEVTEQPVVVAEVKEEGEKKETQEPDHPKSTEVTESQPQLPQPLTEEEPNKHDVNNNPADLPVVVVEATAVYVRSANNDSETSATSETGAVTTETNGNASATEAPAPEVA